MPLFKKSITHSLLTLALACAAPSVLLAQHADATQEHAVPPAGVKTNQWPQTNPGKLGAGWVKAYSSGEAAMRAFITHSMAEEALKERGIEERIVTYKTSHALLGGLKLVEVMSSTPDELTVGLTAADGSEHTFIFTTQSAAPHKLLSVKRLEHEMRTEHGHGQ